MDETITVIIIGLVAGISLVYAPEFGNDIAIAATSGLVGYLSKGQVIQNEQTRVSNNTDGEA